MKRGTIDNWLSVFSTLIRGDYSLSVIYKQSQF